MRTLLIDADLLVYRFASVHQHAVCWDEQTWTVYGDLAGAVNDLDRWIGWLTNELDADEVKLFLSDPKANWRHDLFPDYKGQRAAWARRKAGAAAGGLPPKPGPERPMLYKPLREHMARRYEARFEPHLEGDDILGIVATKPGGGDRVVVSSDKDLQTVPCQLFNPDHPFDGVRTISLGEADRFHLLQTLSGDRTDNYPGCPGLGPVKAARIVDDDPTWAAVVKAYVKAGKTEDEALVQARIARICRHGDYNRKTGEIKLWTPS